MLSHTKIHKIGSQKTQPQTQLHNHNHAPTQILTRLKSRGLCKVDSCHSHTHTHTHNVTQIAGLHRTTDTATSNHRHADIQHRIPAAAHARAHTHTQPHKHGVILLAAFPSLVSPPPHPRYHTQSRWSLKRLQTGLHRVPGEPPPTQPESWRLGAQIWQGGGCVLSVGGAFFEQLGSPRDKGGGLGDLCPETLDQAWEWGLPQILLILFKLGRNGVEFQAQGPRFEKGMCLGLAQELGSGGWLCSGSLPVRPGDRLCLESPPTPQGVGSVEKLYPGPQDQNLVVLGCCAQRPLVREG
jgi:hypothetical protein